MSIPLPGTAPSKAVPSSNHVHSKNVSPAPRAKSTDLSPGANRGANAAVSASQRRRRNQQSFKQNGSKPAQQSSEPMTIPQQQSSHVLISQNGFSMTEPQSEDSGKPKRRQRMRGKAAMSSGAIPSSKAAQNQHQQQNQQDALKRSTTAPTVTPVKPAYAGPTFHASPAASALPMPKFLSKSVPDPNAGQGLQSLLETEETTDGNEVPVNGSHQGTLSTQAVQSPLEIFFRADREEKARRVVSSPDPNSPSSRVSSLSNRNTPSANKDISSFSSPLKRPVSSGQYGKEMFMMELSDSGPERTFTQSTHQLPSLSNNHVQRTANNSKVNTQQPHRHVESNSMPSPPFVQTSVNYDNNQLQGGQQLSDKSTTYTTPPSQNHRSYSPAKTTPSAETDGEQFLYGNRNLSPLFKATKREQSSPGPKLPSSLRREVTDSQLTASFKDIKPNDSSNPSIADKPGYRDNASAAAISRDYLQSHIQKYSDAVDKNTNKKNTNVKPSSGSRSYQNRIQIGHRPHTVDGSVHDPLHPIHGSSMAEGSARRHDAAAATTGKESSSEPGSVETMEENLKRLLKLNADG